MNIDPRYRLLSILNADGSYDGGDTLSNESFARLANVMRRKLGYPPVMWGCSDQAFIDMVLLNDGTLQRSPGPALLMDKKFQVSRDQTFMFLLWLWVGLKLGTFEAVWRTLKTFWPYYQNSDVQGLELLIPRSRQYHWVLRRWLGDLSLVINSFARCGYLPRWKHDVRDGDRLLFNLPSWCRYVWRLVPLAWDDVGDDKLHIATLAAVHIMGPTRISQFATRFYFRHRPKVEGPLHSYDCSPPLAALRHYFRAETGNSPEIAEAWGPVLSKLETIYS